MTGLTTERQLLKIRSKFLCNLTTHCTQEWKVSITILINVFITLHALNFVEFISNFQLIKTTTFQFIQKASICNVWLGVNNTFVRLQIVYHRLILLPLCSILETINSKIALNKVKTCGNILSNFAKARDYSFHRKKFCKFYLKISCGWVDMPITP